MIAFWLVVAGGCGAAARFVVDGVIRSRVRSSFPWATLAINVTGSFLLGLLTALVLFHGQGETARAVIGTGFCGGYTTFSTTAFESVRLLQRGKARLAVLSAAGSLALTMCAGAAGLAIGSL